MIVVSDKNRRRPVSRADDTDRCRILQRKAEERRHAQREENAELRRRAEQHHLRIGEKRRKVDHRADADEEQQQKNLIRDAGIKEHVQRALGQHAVQCLRHRTGIRQVDQDGTEAHRYEKSRLHFFPDAQVDHDAADHPHDDHLWRDISDVAKEVQNFFHCAIPPFKMRGDTKKDPYRRILVVIKVLLSVLNHTLEMRADILP